MLLINGRQLLLGESLKDVNHPLHAQAVEYDTGLKEIREKHGKTIKFIRPGFPKLNPGADSEGRETTLVEPPTPAVFPLQTYHNHPTRGRELWACCLGLPKLLPNQMWEIGDKRSFTVTDSITVDLDKEPDFAFYLYYICRAVKRSGLVVDDPQRELRERAAKEMELVERKTAVWQLLKDEKVLRKIAAAYEIDDAATKDANSLRFDLEAKLSANDELRKRDPSVKGTKEFLEEMKVTDNVRLRAFIKSLIDDKVIIYKPDGRYRVGEKILMQVPQSELQDKFNFICNFYGAPNNGDKLQELMRDIFTKSKLDDITDEKELTWLAKVMGVQTAFKKKEELRDMVYGTFDLVP